ncbi:MULTISPECIES: hypothetical protein [unclassified Microcoleus]|uniref:hypothetical protein n=1 Tax=unclassified Microcoleus TaxID=2642155 RepID=UPI0025DEE834|nr:MULTISPECIES: hypothetical protein [unclassified Microcoleus]
MFPARDFARRDNPIDHLGNCYVGFVLRCSHLFDRIYVRIFKAAGSSRPKNRPYQTAKQFVEQQKQCIRVLLPKIDALIIEFCIMSSEHAHNILIV